jgi:diaphanous 1
MSISRLPERLECMIYRRKSELDLAEIRPELDSLWNASREMRQSQKFKQVLQTVLLVGNALNGSSFRGGARGFQLDSLAKVWTISSIARKAGLIYFLVKGDPNRKG